MKYLFLHDFILLLNFTVIVIISYVNNLSFFYCKIDDKRKKLFAVHPKPPSGFKDYLLNKRTYVLAGNSKGSIVKTQTPPPANLHEQLKKLFVEQENERQKLSTQVFLILQYYNFNLHLNNYV